MHLLDIKNLKTHFFTDSGVIRAVDGVSLHVDRGEFVAIVGGSGSGKTILSLSVLRLVPEPGRIVSGSMTYDGIELTKLPLSELRKIRGKGISMIFQEPMTSLNPVFTIGDQIAEAITVHDPKRSRAAVVSEAASLLELVGIPEPKKKLKNYPFELSGGQRQRVMIAMALSCKPGMLIADEPTTALDVTIQAQILELLAGLRKKLGMSVMLITHDFGIVAQTADRVYVMHEGKVVEDGPTVDIFRSPKDDYTKSLLKAVPIF